MDMRQPYFWEGIILIVKTTLSPYKHSSARKKKIAQAQFFLTYG